MLTTSWVNIRFPAKVRIFKKKKNGLDFTSLNFIMTKVV